MSKSTDPLKDRTALIEDLDRLAKEATSVGNPKANAIALITAIRKFASIQCIISDQADIQTRRIVRLTWGLFILTVALLVLTAYLSYDIYQKRGGSEQAEPHTAQK